MTVPSVLAGGAALVLLEQNRLYQKHSPVPMFIAANCDAGAEECIPEGSFIATASEAGFPMLVTAKHFPGDGADERDQHLLISCNDLSAGEWEDTFGRVYRGLIGDGIEAVMAGHIRQRALSKRETPALRDEDILPASLSPELLQGVLRGELGFQGLIISDATQMVGFASAMPRRKALPAAVTAGCDMILFANDMAEDLGFLRDALEDGSLSKERLDEALTRILGMKAKLGLHEGVKFPEAELMRRYIGCEEHARFRAEAAERCVTLVKDTQGLIPVNPVGKRVLLIYEHNAPSSKAYRGDPMREVVFNEELERAGFAVDIWPNFFDLEAENGADLANFLQMMDRGPRTPFAKRYDLAVLALNFDGFAQTSKMRLAWSLPHGKDKPWYISEVPTAVVSLKYTNHLNDVPQAKTYILAYGSARENIRAAVEKLTGRSAFTGQADETVFCGRWDTRL